MSEQIEHPDTHIETLIVEEYGAYVGKHSERLRVSVKGESRHDAPLIHLRQVIVKSRGVSLSTDAIVACAERGIPIHVVSGVGLAQGAALYAAGLGGTVQTRRAQLLAYTDARGMALARAFAQAKLNNQAGLLKYQARSRKQTDPALHKQLMRLAHEVSNHLDELKQGAWPNVDAARSALLSIEGRAAKRYWEGVRLALPPDMGDTWPGRRGRGARDPLNSALNYGYAILARAVEQAIVCAGLDPFAGFVHVDRPGKPSLTLDLIEEFRQAVVDRTVLGMVGNRMELTVLDNGLLDDAARRSIAEKVVARLEQSGEPYEGKKHCLREIIQMQARHLATFVRTDRPAYEGYVARW
jgi:CRISPR-associated protein Cas1